MGTIHPGGSREMDLFGARLFIRGKIYSGHGFIVGNNHCGTHRAVKILAWAEMAWGR